MANMPAIFREYQRLERLREDDGLSLDELARWSQLKRILATHFKPGTDHEDADKRASLRIPSRVRVDYESLGTLRPCLMTNISRGGVFIACDSPLPVGSSIVLRIQIGEPKRLLELPGEVTTTNAGPNLLGEERGMGIRFSFLSAEQQAQVGELYGEAMENALGG